MRYPKLMYDSLFDASWDTINTFARDEKHLGATTGMISILHTWRQQLTLHPHLHCIIPAGGLTKQGKWKHSKTNGNYLFPVKALSVVFRAKYTHHLRKNVVLFNAKNNTTIVLPKQLIDSCFKKQWVVYAKRPFSGVNSVVEYLGRYTHKVAISNHRIIHINNTTNSISFTYKDYKDGAKKKTLTLDAMEFVRRFNLHILPKAFVRIRHYGILSSTSKTTSITNIRKQLPPVKQSAKTHQTTPYNPLQCPCCKKETMMRLLNFDMRGPPSHWKQHAKLLLQNLSKN